MKQATCPMRHGLKIVVKPVPQSKTVVLTVKEGKRAECIVGGTLAMAEKLRDDLTRAIEAAREGLPAGRRGGK